MPCLVFYQEVCSMNRLQKYRIPLTLLAGVCWAALAGVFYWLHRAYDGAIHSGAVYLLVMLLTQLVTAFTTQTPQANPQARGSRLCVLLFVCLIAIILSASLSHGLLTLSFLPIFFLAGLVLPALAVFLSFRRRRKWAHTPVTPISQLLFCCAFSLYLIGMIFLYLIIFHPLPLSNAQELAAARGFEYVGHRSGDKSRTLGVYWFVNDRDLSEYHADLYFDVLTGEEVCVNEILR